jgi:hypothetical protein
MIHQSKEIKSETRLYVLPAEKPVKEGLSDG